MKKHILQNVEKARIIVWVIAIICPFFIPTKPGIARSVNSGFLSYTAECYSNYCNFLPVILNDRMLPEIDPSPCHWLYDPNEWLAISYKWGSGLQIPGSTWRIAFQSGINSWNNTYTPVYYYPNTSSANKIDIAYLPDIDAQGVTTIFCNGDEIMDWIIIANTYYDYAWNYTIHERLGIATHELGHGIGLGHIPDWFLPPAIMYAHPSIVFF